MSGVEPDLAHRTGPEKCCSARWLLPPLEPRSKGEGQHRIITELSDLSSGSTGNRTQSLRLRGECSTLELWTREWVAWESNPPCPEGRRVYSAVAHHWTMPTQYPSPEQAGGFHHCYSRCQRATSERLVGIEPTCSGWQPDAQPMGDSRVHCAAFFTYEPPPAFLTTAFPVDTILRLLLREPQARIELATSGLRNRRYFRLSY